MTAFLIMLVLATLAAELWSLFHGLDGVEYDLRLPERVLEPDEEFQMVTVVTNRRRHFLPFVRLDEDVPADLRASRPLFIANYTEQRTQLQSKLYLMPRQRLTRRTQCRLSRRGRHLFLGATLYGGDFLGLGERGRPAPLEREAVVLPRALPGIDVERLLGGAMGDVSVNRFILEDPILSMGFREYTGREPMKRIAWAQSARAGRLMVRQQDFTVERAVTVLFNADTFAFGTHGSEAFDRCCSLARGVCEALEKRRMPYAFYSNARAPGRPDGFGQTGEGLGGAHLAAVLEGLARADGTAWESMDALLRRAEHRAEPGRVFVLITPVENDLRPERLNPLSRRTGTSPIPLTAKFAETLQAQEEAKAAS